MGTETEGWKQKDIDRRMGHRDMHRKTETQKREQEHRDRHRGTETGMGTEGHV